MAAVVIPRAEDGFPLVDIPVAGEVVVTRCRGEWMWCGAGIC